MRSEDFGSEEIDSLMQRFRVTLIGGLKKCRASTSRCLIRLFAGASGRYIHQRARDILKSIPGARSFYRSFRRIPGYMRVTHEYLLFRKLSTASRPEFFPLYKDLWFELMDRTASTGFEPHYVYHTAWAVRKLRLAPPKRHVDVSSSVYFVALGSAVVPILHIDYRPLPLVLDGVECRIGDLQQLEFSDGSIESLSYMHVIEHIGLGRYGDTIDPNGDRRAASELIRVLAPEGNLMIVVPVGRARTCFNAHRVYSFQQVRELFKPLTLVEWALVPDNSQGGLIENPDPIFADAQHFGCGCFFFKKSMDSASVNGS